MNQTTTSDEGQLQRPNEVGVLIAGIAERLGGSASARAVYGEPIERDGTTVVPVATVRFGYGGGRSLKKEQEPGAGLGAGAGARITPVGFLEIRSGETKFRRIKVPSPFLRGALLLAGIWLVRRALSSLTAS